MKPRDLPLRIGLGAFSVFSSTCFLLFARYGFPVPGIDSFWFLVPAVNVAAGRGLISQIMARYMLSIDPTGMNRFLIYPPLFPWLIGHLMGPPSPFNALTVLAAVNSLSLALTAVGIYRVIQISGPPKRMTYILAMLCLVGTASMMVYYEGCRPEALGNLWVRLGLVLALCFPDRPFWLMLGPVLGILGATHPVGAALSALLILAFHSAKLKPLQALLSTTKTVGVSIVVFLALLRVSPYSLRELLQGLHVHAQVAYSNTTTIPYGDLLRYHVLGTDAPLFGFIFVVSWWLGFQAAWKRRKFIASPVFFWPALVLFVLGVLYTAFWNSSRAVSAHMFSLVNFGLILFALQDLPTRLPMQSVVTGLLTVCALGFVRCVLLFPLYLHHGVTLDKARALFKNLRTQYPSDTRYNPSQSLWTLSEDYSVFHDDSPDSDPVTDHTVYLIQQQYFGTGDAPRQIKGLRIEADFFNRKLPKIGPLPLGTRMPGYGFAVYVPDKPAEKRKPTLPS